MAIQNGIKLPGGQTVDNSYLKIGDVNIEKVTDSIGFGFLAYYNKEAREADPMDFYSKLDVKQKTYFNINGNDPFYISNIKPKIDELKAELYKWSKINGYSNFTDVV
jgi:hypothetical protein